MSTHSLTHPHTLKRLLINLKPYLQNIRIMCVFCGCGFFHYISFIYAIDMRIGPFIFTWYKLSVCCGIHWHPYSTNSHSLHLLNNVCLNFKNKQTYISPLWILRKSVCVCGSVSATLQSWSFDLNSTIFDTKINERNTKNRSIFARPTTRRRAPFGNRQRGCPLNCVDLCPRSYLTFVELYHRISN